jgi:hypothetical protein
MYTWHGQGINLGASTDNALYVWPSFRSNVTIKKCRTVVLDIDLSLQFISVVVWGTLRIQDRGPSSTVSIRALCINIKPGGKLLAGELDQPYSGVLEFLLAGDMLTESAHCGGRKGMRWDVSTNATMKLYGQKPLGSMWSRLRHTVEMGESQLKLIGRLDFQVDDRLAIAGTGDRNTETEYATVASVDYVPTQTGGVDTRITLNAGLMHKHIAVRETHGTKTLDMRAEVALIFRGPTVPAPAIMDLVDLNGVPIRRSSFIQIAGVDTYTGSPKFRFRAAPEYGLILTVAMNASMVLSGVMATGIGKSGGARGRARAGIACLGSCNIRNSLFIPQKGDGIDAEMGSDKARSHTIVENVVFFQYFRGVEVSSTTRLLNSAFISGIGNDAGAIEFAGCGYTTDSLNRQYEAKIFGNAIAGAGYGLKAFSGYCLHRDSIANNTIHSAGTGIAIKESVGRAVRRGQRLHELGKNDQQRSDQRGVIGTGFVLWRIQDIGVWLYTISNEPVFGGGIIVADAKIGLVWSNVGPDPELHTLERQRATVSHATFIGRSYTNAQCGTVRAVLLPVSTSRGPSISPGVCGSLGGPLIKGVWGVDRNIGSYPTLLAETRVTDSTFMRYFSDSCGSATVFETFQGGSQDSSDGVPPLFIQRTTIDAGSRSNLANLKNPKKAWIVPTKCGVMDCDGPKQVMIHDLDGSFTGMAAGSSILARSDFMNTVRLNGKDTWYNIPTKMLYDPAPYNDPSHLGWDVSHLQALMGGNGGLFSYDRRLEQTSRAMGNVSGDAVDVMATPAVNDAIGRMKKTHPDANTTRDLATSRRLSEAPDLVSEWKNKMVFYTGNESSSEFGKYLSKQVSRMLICLLLPT